MTYGDELDRILADAERASSRKELFGSLQGIELSNTLLLFVLKALVVIGKSLNEKRQITT
jgi:hypothetical protein